MRNTPGAPHRAWLLAALLLVGVVRPLAAQSDVERELYRAAEDDYRSGNSLIALERFQQFVQRYPLSDRIADAQYRIGVCQYRLGRYADAIETFRRVESRYASTRFFDLVYFWAGMASYHLGRWADAVQAFERFEGRIADPDLNAQALLARALSEEELGTPDEAARTLERLLASYPASRLRGQALLHLMEVRLRTGKLEAVLDIDPAALPQPWQAPGRLFRAEALWRLGRQGEAAPLYESLLGEAPELASFAYRRLFDLAQSAGDLPRMEALAQRAEKELAGDPSLLEQLWLRVGAESLQKDDLETAGYFLRRAWDRAGGSGPAALPLYLAEVQIKQGRLDDAAQVLEAASDRKSTAVTMRLGDVRLMQGRFADAAALYEKVAAGSDPQADEAAMLVAYCRYRLGGPGDEAAALDITKRLLAKPAQGAAAGKAGEAGSAGKAGSARLEVLRLQAAILTAQGSLEAATEALTEVADAAPDDTRAALVLLRLLFRRGEYREVVTRASVLIDRSGPAGDPKSRMIALYLKGLSEIALKSYGAALSSLQEITPEKTSGVGLSVIDPYVLYYEGWAHYRQGELAAARDRLLAMAQAYPDHPLRVEALYLAGWCLFSLSDYARALPVLKEVSESPGPRAERAALLYGKTLAAMGRLADAVSVFQALARARGDLADDALFERAAALAALGRVDDAAAGYQEVADSYPSSPLAPEALYRRGTLYRDAHRPADAAAAFTEYRRRFPAGAQMDGALYWGGLSASESGHPFGAVLLWEILIDRYSASSYRPEALSRTAAVYEDRGEPSRALALLEKLASTYPDQAASVKDRIDRLRLVVAGLSEREADLTVRIQRQGGAKTAAGRAAMLDLAALYVHERSDRYDQAAKLLLDVVASGDAATVPRAHYLLAELADARGDPVAAAREFLAAAAAAPNDKDLAPSALYRAAEAMSRAGKREDTKALVARLERAFPGSSWTEEARKLLEVAR